VLTLGIQLRPAVVRVAGILDSHGTAPSSRPSPYSAAQTHTVSATRECHWIRMPTCICVNTP